jgi:MraZ protein
MLTGSYKHPLDAKGRCVVPKALRSQMGEPVFLTRGTDRCLWVFPESGWRSFAAEVERRADPILLRYFLGSAFEVTFDRMGRVQIPVALRDWAGLESEVTIVGVGEHLEIWSAKGWDEMMSQVTPDQIRELLSRQE